VVVTVAIDKRNPAEGTHLGRSGGVVVDGIGRDKLVD
jgi:hypothetical protein